MGRAFLDSSACNTHVSTPTHAHTQTHLPEGLLSITGCALHLMHLQGWFVFVLKQREKNISRDVYGPCPNADLGWASLFQILTSSTALEIPALTPDQHLRMISLHRAAVGTDIREQGGQFWGNTAP